MVPQLTGSAYVETSSISEVGEQPSYKVLRAICNPHVTQKRKRTEPIPDKSLRLLVGAQGLEPWTR